MPKVFFEEMDIPVPDCHRLLRYLRWLSVSGQGMTGDSAKVLPVPRLTTRRPPESEAVNGGESGRRQTVDAKAAGGKLAPPGGKAEAAMRRSST